MDKTAIRDAATIIVVRDHATTPRILMGQRGRTAAFMPNKYVFPGGAVDPVDASVPFAAPLSSMLKRQLEEHCTTPPEALAAAAIRELWEETGQLLSAPGAWNDAPQGWRGFAEAGGLPDVSGLSFIFRAITPPGRPRRFDARFFLVDAAALTTDPDDFSNAEEELSHLHWVPLPEVRNLDLPFVTEVVLAEVAQRIKTGEVPDTVPFFHNDDEAQWITQLGGRSPLDLI